MSTDVVAIAALPPLLQGRLWSPTEEPNAIRLVVKSCLHQPMTTKINPIFQRREISTEKAAKEVVDAFGASLPWVRPMVEIVREEVTV